jgi:hypothetical protein
VVVRAQSVGPPRPISDCDFQEICGTFRIPLQHRTSLRSRLDTLIEVFATDIKQTGSQPGRKKDREAVGKALSYLRKASTEFRAPRGPTAQMALREIAPSIGLMLSAGWLRQHFPANPLVPRPKEPPQPRNSPRRRTEQYDIEDLSLYERCGFVADHPIQTVVAILSDLEYGLRVAAQAFPLLPGAKGGRKRHDYRHYFLINLAVVWSKLGRRVLAGPRSEFTEFCEAAAASVGWPTEGLASAVPKAVKHWRHLHQKGGG